MNEQQANEIIGLLKQNNDLLARGIDLLEHQVRLFEKYDAEALFEEEEIREHILRPRRP
jgi:hypothetical protein